MSLQVLFAAVEKKYTTFTFAENGVTVDEGASTGYAVDETEITINAAGTYVFTGSCSQGAIKVKKNTTGVKLILSGVTLTADGTAPLCCNSGTQVRIFVSEGTVNTLSDTTTNNDDLYPENENAENAVIKLKKNSDTVICGTGTLVIDAKGKNGIKSGAESQLRICNATLQITTAVNDAISADNLLLLESGNVVINSVSEGIKCEPDAEDESSAGKFVMYGGSLSITSAYDGIDTTGPAIFLDGTTRITSGNGSKGTVGTDDSKKGIKSTALIGITGGSFTMDCADDAFHTNGSMAVSGGTFSISTGDDAFHADTALVIGTKGSEDGPEITITTCYEGIEAAYIYLCSGKINITASDDGVNAANSAVQDHKLVIYGGSIYCNAGGDGFDSNNMTCIYGGDTQIFGSANGGNAALDSDGTIACHGGTLIAIGYSEMAQAPLASASTQPSLSFGSSSSMVGPGNTPPGMGGMGGGMGGMGHFISNGPGNPGPGGGGSWQSVNNLSIAQGNTLVIMDSNNNTLYTATAVKTANHVVFTSDALTPNATYYLYINGTKAAYATAQNTSTSSYTALPVPDIALDYTPIDELPSLEDDEEDEEDPVRENTLFTFSDTGIAVTQGPDTAYTISGTTLTITGAGSYEITGSCTDGAIAVDKKVENLTLMLNNLSLTSASTAPICIGKNADVTLTVSGKNVLTDNAVNGGDDNEKAVIKAKSGTDLLLNGTGSLTITANGKNGLKTGAEGLLTIDGVDLTITAPNDAISADDRLVITGGDFQLTADGDAIKSEPDEEDTVSAGTITIQGGTFAIYSGDDGIQSTGALTITGGAITIHAGGCGINCGNAFALAAATETPRLIITASSTAVKAAAFRRDNAILRGVAEKNGIVADSIVLNSGTTELFVANSEEGSCLSPWELSAGTLFVASASACDTADSTSCLTFQATAATNDTIAITDTSGNTLLTTTAAQNATHFLFADSSITTGGSFTLWVNDVSVATCSLQEKITVSQTIATGWNMLYLYIMPEETALTQLCFYDCTDGIFHSVKTPALNKQYFVYNSGSTITLTGTAQVSSDITLTDGWNFVGIPLSTDIDDAMTVFEWNGSAYLPASSLTPGRAYWIKK